MLRTNLVNSSLLQRARRAWAARPVAVVVIVAVTLFNMTQIWCCRGANLALGQEIAAAEGRAQELRARAAQERQAVDPKQLAQISDEAREANAIIGQRLFSWTDLLSRLERRCPTTCALHCCVRRSNATAP